jgi:microcystin-dependent protein
MILTSSGNVGIGTTNPVSTLDVRGNASITGNLTVTAPATVNGYGTIPIGGIIMWSGASVPTGWALCNGGNGTPNLLDRFIIGAGGALGIGTTGGSANATLVSHTHTASTDSAGIHAHRLYISQNSSGNTNRMDTGNVGVAGEGGNATYILNNNNEEGTQVIEDAGSHSHNVGIGTTGFSGINANLPPYFALAFIMRIS